MSDAPAPSAPRAGGKRRPRAADRAKRRGTLRELHAELDVIGRRLVRLAQRVPASPSGITAEEEIALDMVIGALQSGALSVGVAGTAAELVENNARWCAVQLAELRRRLS